MKIVCLLGSPRSRGNSSTLARRFCETAKKHGAEVQTFELNKLHYRGCQGCMTCKAELERCVLEDDLTEVLDAAAQCDVLVMASPVYFGDVSSQLKGFIDRTFSFVGPDYAVNPRPSRLQPGKRFVFIQTQGDPEEDHHVDIFERYSVFFEWTGFGAGRLIRACGLFEEEEALTREDALKSADEAAEALFA